MKLYKILSLLLEYPTSELCAHWDDLRDEILLLDNAVEKEKQSLLDFICWAERHVLTKLQETYVRTFDLTPDNALYLTHHLFEEQDRDRGPTLVELSEFFQSEGFAIEGGELPDYLPLVLEYVSTLEDERGARLFLKDSSRVAGVIAANLESQDSPYAPLLRIVENHGRLTDVAGCQLRAAG